MRLKIIFVGMVLLLVGCKAISKLDRSDEYKKSKPHDKSLVLPQDINSSVIKNKYPMPQTKKNGKKSSLDVTVVPPGCKL